MNDDTLRVWKNVRAKMLRAQATVADMYAPVTDEDVARIVKLGRGVSQITEMIDSKTHTSATGKTA